MHKTAAFLAAATATIFAMLAGAATGHASSGLLGNLMNGCQYGQMEQPFAPWGDDSHYVLAPGGSFEGTNSWSLAGGARIVSGNEPFYLNSPTDSHSLSIPAGGSATTPAICLGILDPTLRLVGASSDGSPIRVDVYASGVLGLVKLPDSATIDVSSTWGPSTVQVLTLQNVLALTNLGTTNIVLRFSSTGSASVQMDDVYLDPLWHG